MRRLRCWLLGHRKLCWDEHPFTDRDATCCSLVCSACRQGLEQFEVTHTLFARYDRERGDLWDEMQWLNWFHRRPLWRRVTKR